VSPDDLLTPREAEWLIGRYYGWLEQGRRMISFIREYHPEDLAEWTEATPPWVKVGNAIRYRRGDVMPFATNRAGENRGGTCGTCSHFKHGDWEIDTEWFDPNRAYCRWATDTLTVPRGAPSWVRGRLQKRVDAKGGRYCPAYTPKGAGA
jgi:hypothetical protein